MVFRTFDPSLYVLGDWRGNSSIHPEDINLGGLSFRQGYEYQRQEEREKEKLSHVFDYYIIVEG
jgi:hypothetical protein